MNATEFARLPESDVRYELVEGRLVRMSGSGNEATSIAAFLIAALVAFVRPKRLGRVSSSDDSFNLTRPSDTAETILMPDVAFVRAGSESPVATLQATDMLDGLDILPGFTYPGAATFRRI